ncbi:AAA family ATPase [Anabaena sp. PCC 7108]|uniref:AAA family ATPase n=1 Tax=Anabaena sp. PCC 7108 TaxID=163908 RepID=UPI000346296F|nr:ATP-binding protein [Anabaena sp. PCC 7108]
MKNELAKVKNLRRLSQAYEALKLRDHSVPGMGLVSGFTGSGKTRSISWLVEQSNGVYCRANATWSVSAMLGSISSELGVSPQHRNYKMLGNVAEWFASAQRPLFIDECDYLLRDLRMVEALRDIHDLSGVPVMLVGMEGIEKKLALRLQLTRRISQFVEFQPLDIEDARVLADTVSEVAIADDLLTKIHQEAKGGVGLMIVGLARVEALAKTQQWQTIGASQWGQRKLFLTKAG